MIFKKFRFYYILLILVLTFVVFSSLSPVADNGMFIDTHTIKRVQDLTTINMPQFPPLLGKLWCDYIMYKVFTYNSLKRVTGPCGQELSGRFTVSKGYTVSYGGSQATSGTGSATSGGAPTDSKISGSIQSTITSTWNLSQNQNTSNTLNYKCKAIPGKRATAKITLKTKEYAAVYINYHVFGSSTQYEFHVHTHSIDKYDCEYKPCSNTPGDTSAGREEPGN